MAKEIILRRSRYEELLKELEERKTVKRKEITERIGVAKEFGDLSENDEYTQARNDQGFNEGKIMELEALLKNAIVTDDEDMSDTSSNTITVGSKVTLYDTEFDEEVVYELVGATEADMKQMKITTDSPLGKAMINKAVGDSIEVRVQDNILSFVVKKIEK